MKTFLTLLLLNSIILMAEHLSTEDCKSCKINFSDAKKEKKIDEAEKLLSTTLEKVRQYKKTKDSEIERLTNQLDKLSREFNAYKIKKEKEIKKIKVELNNTQNRLLALQNKQERRVDKSLSWVEVEVEDDIDIYQLALKYYGEEEAYQEIYYANENLIGDDYSIPYGASLRIPITDKFKEQPIFLNLD